MEKNEKLYDNTNNNVILKLRGKMIKLYKKINKLFTNKSVLIQNVIFWVGFKENSSFFLK
jgi:hypothetical protein